MRSKIKLTTEPIIDLEILKSTCTNNNQICYHIKKNEYLIKYLETITGLKAPVMVLFYHYKEGIKEVPKCICGKDRKYHCNGYRPTCGKMKCQSIVRENSKKEYCLENYGVEFVTQLESMKMKSKLSCLERYGVDNITKSPEVIKKRKESNFIKYGVTDPIMLKSVRGDESIIGLKQIQSGLPKGYLIISSDKKYTYQISCVKGHIFNMTKSNLSLKRKNNIEICNQCNEYIGSNGEQDVYNYVSSIYDKSISRSNRKLISPFEIDMVLDDIKLCIEFNGDYWHSIKIVDDQFYHLNKLNMCLSKGYKLVQIRENDWNNNKDIIKKKLFNLINNIIDMDDFVIENNLVKVDLSWYDDRVSGDLIDSTMPNIIISGQYEQWNCGYRFYKPFMKDNI